MPILYQDKRASDIRDMLAEHPDITPVLVRIQRAARDALRNFPTPEEIDRLPPRGKRAIGRMRQLMEAGIDNDNWDPATLAEYLGEVTWSVAVTDGITGFMTKDNAGGGAQPGEGCSTRCRKVYERCVNDEGCDTDCWICICESTCSLEYVACGARCLVTGFAGSQNELWGV